METERQERTELRGLGERIFAGFIMSTLLVQIPGFSLIPGATFLAGALAITFVWTAPPQVKRLAGLAVLALATGMLMLGVSTATGLAGSTFATWASVVLWLSALALLPAAAAWAMDRLGPRTAVLLMLAGGTIGAVGINGFSWKGTVGIFLTGFVLVLLARQPFFSTLVLVGAVAVSFTNDARSMAVAAAASLVFQVLLRSKRESGGLARGFRLIVSVVLIGAAALWAFVGGLAGAEVQARTLDQLSKANAIFGVRAEWASTLSLFEARPLGFGIGAQPSDAEANNAISAVQRAGGDWTSSYFSEVVLGERVDLHSTAANLWFHFGVGGVLVVLMLAILLFKGVRDSSLSTSQFGAGGIFVLLIAGWDLFFSPMADVNRVIAGLVVAISIVMMTRGTAMRRQERSASFAYRAAP